VKEDMTKKNNNVEIKGRKKGLVGNSEDLTI